jgi:hypothetical protein
MAEKLALRKGTLQQQDNISRRCSRIYLALGECRRRTFWLLTNKLMHCIQTLCQGLRSDLHPYIDLGLAVMVDTLDLLTGCTISCHRR